MYFLAKDIDHCAPNLLLFLAISSQPLCKGLGQSNRDHPLEKPMFLLLHMNNKNAQRGQWNKEGMLSVLKPASLFLICAGLQEGKPENDHMHCT